MGIRAEAETQELAREIYIAMVSSAVRLEREPGLLAGIDPVGLVKLAWKAAQAFMNFQPNWREP
jgi:hypothetical protein